MSRIITDTYFEKLKCIINELDYTSNLYYLLSFFEREFNNELHRNEIRKIFSKKDELKIKKILTSKYLKKIYTYVNYVIEKFEGKYFHIHLNIDFSEILIENFITLTGLDFLLKANYDDNVLNQQLDSLKLLNTRPLESKDNNGHSLNKLFRERYGNQHKQRFIEHVKNIKQSSNINNNKGVLLNFNSGANNFVNISEFSIFPESLNTYLNFGNSRKDFFKLMGSDKVDRLSMIINVFPSITGKNIWYKDFMNDEINRYNNFKKIITITNGKKTPEVLFEMYKQNKFQAEEIYTIFSFELK